MANLALLSSEGGASGRLRAWQGARRNATLYAAALSLVAMAFILRSGLAPTLGDQALYLFLVPPVLIAGAGQRHDQDERHQLVRAGSHGAHGGHPRPDAEAGEFQRLPVRDRAPILAFQD
jgi:hypothetical protein